MGLLNDLFVRIRGDNKGLKDSLKDSEAQVGKFGGSVGKLGSGFAALGAVATIVLGAVVSWFKSTDMGAKAVNVTMTVLKQTLTDIFNLDKSHGAEAAYWAKQQSDIIAGQARETFLASKMQRELNELRLKAAGEGTPASKLETLKKASDKEKELKKYVLDSAIKERDVLMELYLLNLDNTKAKEAYYAAATKVENIKGSDSLRIEQQITATTIAATNRAKELFDVFNYGQGTSLKALNERLVNYKAELADIDKNDRVAINTLQKKINLLETEIELYNKLPGKIKIANTEIGQGSVTEQMFGLKGADRSGKLVKGKAVKFEDSDSIKQWKQSWADAVAEVTSLISDAFIGVFESIGKGSFQGFGDALLQNFGQFIANFGKMLVAMGTSMLLALTLMKAPSIPTAIAAIVAGTAAMAAGGLMMGMASKQSGNLGGSGGGSGGSGGLNSQQIKVIVEGRIKGKDIVIASRRYEESNG